MGNAQAKQARNAAAANDVPRLTQIVSSRGGQEALLRHSFWKARTALHCAARAGCAEALAAVIEVAAHRTTTAAGESLSGFLNAPDHAGDTALALACKHGHADCLRELLEAGALPLPANAQGTTPLHYAALRGHAACLRLLLSSYVRLPDGSRGRTADALVPDVIDTERYLDTRAHSGLCALHLAVLSGSQSAVVELVTAGAQLDTPLLPVGLRTPMLLPPCLAPGSTALHMAAATGRASLVTTLLHAQQQRHPGLELRRMRNARGMTPLNVALLCGFSNMASLLAAGAPLPAAPPAARSRQLPPLLRQQLLVLVHRAALLSQLRQLGLGSAAAAEPPLPPGTVQRLESLLHSDSATASQVLAAVDELLENATAAHAAAHAAAGAGGGGGAGAGEQRGGQRSRRRQRRLQQERERVARQLASAQAGADWTLLDRNRTLWHAEHSSSLYRRLHRRQERHAPLAALSRDGEAAAAGEAAPRAAQEGAAMLAGALLGDEGEERPRQQHPERQQQQQGAGQPSASSGGSGSSGSDASSSGEEDGRKPGCAAGQLGAAAAAAAAGSEAEAQVCPVCLDLPADISLAPCGHAACMACCGRLASYSSTNSSFGLPLQSPLCPLCRAPIEAFKQAAPA